MEFRKPVNIPSYDHYEVCEQGNIYNIATGKKIKDWQNSQRYHRVRLYRDGKSKDFYVHRIVAITFHECPGEGYEVHHKDNNRSHNWKNNLEWLTRAENMAHVHAGWLNRKWAKKANAVQPVEVDYSKDFADPANGDDLPF